LLLDNYTDRIQVEVLLLDNYMDRIQVGLDPRQLNGQNTRGVLLLDNYTDRIHMGSCSWTIT
jgi:hypothetical protein